MQISSEPYSISKEQAYIIKGIAILLMFVHHFFTFPDWIVPGSYEPNLTFAALFNLPTRLCVGLFAFLNGWTLAFRPLTCKAAWNKIKKLFLGYWCIAIPAILFAAVICRYPFTVLSAIAELFGFNHAVMFFNWYVPFYAVSVLLVLGMQKMLSKNVCTGLIFGVILPIFVLTLVKKLPFSSDMKTLITELRHWFPCIAVGYMSYQNNWLGWLHKITASRSRYAAAIGLMLFCLAGRYFAAGFDFIYCALFVFAVTRIFTQNTSIFARFLTLCGRHSANMWYLHCLYFSVATRAAVQHAAYFAKYPPLIFTVAVLELLTASALVSRIKTAVRKNGN